MTINCYLCIGNGRGSFQVIGKNKASLSEVPFSFHREVMPYSPF